MTSLVVADYDNASIGERFGDTPQGMPVEPLPVERTDVAEHRAITVGEIRRDVALKDATEEIRVDRVRYEQRPGPETIQSVCKIDGRSGGVICCSGEPRLRCFVIPLAAEGGIAPVVDDVVHDCPAPSSEGFDRMPEFRCRDLDHHEPRGGGAGMQICSIEGISPNLLEMRVDEPEAEIRGLLRTVQSDVGHVIATPGELESQLCGPRTAADVVHRNSRKDHDRRFGDGIAS